VPNLISNVGSCVVWFACTWLATAGRELLAKPRSPLGGDSELCGSFSQVYSIVFGLRNIGRLRLACVLPSDKQDCDLTAPRVRSRGWLRGETIAPRVADLSVGDPITWTAILAITTSGAEERRRSPAHRLRRYLADAVRGRARGISHGRYNSEMIGHVRGRPRVVRRAI